VYVVLLLLFVSGQPGLLLPVEGLVASELDGIPSLVVVHAYVPGAITLAQAHLQPTQVQLYGCCCLHILWCDVLHACQERHFVITVK
jgi:hypothetical protein